MIIDATSLYQTLNEQTYCLLDVRPRSDYLKAHIAGAIHFDATQTNASQPPINGLLPDINLFEAYANSKGLTPTKPIIVYDQQGGPSCGRVAWTLLSYGHPNVSILNGGIEAWLSEGYPSESIETHPSLGDFKATLIDDYIADQAYILKKLADANTVFLDVRTEDEYNGSDMRAARGGHIPGAVNMNWAESKDSKNGMRFKNEPVLKKHFEQLGISQDKEIIVYCQSHQRSALIWLLLKSLGYPQVRGYPGAWSDWGNSNGTPIE